MQDRAKWWRLIRHMYRPHIKVGKDAEEDEEEKVCLIVVDTDILRDKLGIICRVSIIIWNLIHVF